MVMRFADTVGIFHTRLARVVPPTPPDGWQPDVAEIIEAAYWGRAVLEVVKSIDFQSYNHQLVTDLRPAHSASDPHQPGLAMALRDHGGTITLEALLGVIIHKRYFSFGASTSEPYIVAISDRNVAWRVLYSDFIAALQSLALSKRLTILASCHILEPKIKRDAGFFDSGNDGSIPPSVDMLALIGELISDEMALKKRIMSEVFGITDAPAHILPELRFFLSSLLESGGIVIGFTPPWEEGQKVLSPSVPTAQLFGLIRDHYR